ncbi:MAG: peptidylprolyl isomerase [Candidatus Cloacimonetes bacterium]|nr:peptidylprolyl isomerase [Candidatus Cloacimonadota bacterium]
MKYVAIVNNFKIYQNDYKAELYQLLKENNIEEPTKQLKETAINNLIDACLLKDESQKCDICIDESSVHFQFQEIQSRYGSHEDFIKDLADSNISVDKLLENIGNGLRIKEYIKREFLDSVNIKPERIRDFYDTHKEKLQYPERARICHILISNRDPHAFDKLEEVSKKLYENEDFCDIANDYSECPSAKKSGDLGFIKRGDLVEELENVIFSLNKDQVAGPIPTDFGFHFVKLIEKEEKRIPPYDEIKDSLRKQLEKITGELELLKCIRKLRSKAQIEILYDQL